MYRIANLRLTCMLAMPLVLIMRFCARKLGFEKGRAMKTIQKLNLVLKCLRIIDVLTHVAEKLLALLSMINFYTKRNESEMVI
jgi:hypothetical protein